MKVDQDNQFGLASGFIRSVEQFPGRNALEVGGEAFTYASLHGRAASLAATLDGFGPPASPPLTGVFASRSSTAYSAILGALLGGSGYVPLNASFPAARTLQMLSRAGCRSVVVDAASEPGLGAVLGSVPWEMLVILPDRAEVSDLQDRWPGHRFVGSAGLLPGEGFEPKPVDPDAVAYVLFTSGSTGSPKGVMVTHANAACYLRFVAGRYSIGPDDRVSQSFELTFDPSVHDMFGTWAGGACLCGLGKKQLFNPTRFITDSRLTVWYSVPSIATFMKKLGALAPGGFPGLRLSLFSGEALPLELARAWADAAPNSVLENLYGPTEATINCTYYRWDPGSSPEVCRSGIVPIGHAVPETELRVVDPADLTPAPAGEGELIVGGGLVSAGYLGDPERTRTAFVVPPGESQTFYRTGDRVCRLADGTIQYLGRLDHQLKVRGNRVELGEIEAAVRRFSGHEGVVALGWPLTDGGADGIVAFVEGEGDSREVLEGLRQSLPGYMVPSRLLWRDRLPLSPNGKFDRKAMLAELNGSAGPVPVGQG